MDDDFKIMETDEPLTVDKIPEVSAYVFDNGDIKKREEVEKSRNIKSISNLMDTDIDEFGQAYSSGSVYMPPLNLNNLRVFSYENPYHQRCINQIANDCCSGYDIITIDKNGKEVPDNGKRDSKDKILYNFFDNVCPDNPENDIIEVLKQGLINYNTFGFQVTELVRDRIGRPYGLYPAHADTFRIGRKLTNDNFDTDMKFMLQIINVHERIFKIFGPDKYKKYYEPHTGNIMSEVLYMRNYHISGEKYGIPNWFPALKAMLGNDKVAEYNITFFNNEAVPRFAVIVEGGKLGDEAEKKIRSYFKKGLKGTSNSNKTLVLSTQKGASIKLMPLATDNKDGSFRFYKKDNRDEIITAHGVPHHRIQVMDSAGSGVISKDAMFQLDKIYKYSIIEPLQHKEEVMMNTLIKYGFGIDNKRFKLQDLDIGEEAQKAETMKTIATAHEKYLSLGVMRIDDVRRDIHQVPYNDLPDVDEDVKDWANIPRPIFLIRQAQQQQMMMGLNGNVTTGNINEQPNEFNDKSKEQTQGNTQFTDDQLNQLMMKRKNNK